jgi:hypothetical protein
MSKVSNILLNLVFWNNGMTYILGSEFGFGICAGYTVTARPRGRMRST